MNNKEMTMALETANTALESAKAENNALQAEISAIKASANYKAMSTLARLIDDASSVKTELKTDKDGKEYTVNKITIGESTYALTSDTLATSVKSIETLIKINKVAPTAVYIELARIEKDGAYKKAFAVDNIADLGHKLYNLKRDTIVVNLRAIKTFYDIDSGEPLTDYAKNVEISKLVQVLGVINKKCGGSLERFVAEYLDNGEIVLAGAQSAIKKAVAKITTEISDNASDNASDKASDNASDNAGDKASDKASDNASDNAGDNASDKASDNASDNAGKNEALTNQFEVSKAIGRIGAYAKTLDEETANKACALLEELLKLLG